MAVPIGAIAVSARSLAPDLARGAGVAHTLTGYAGGVGYAAIAGLVAIRVRNRGRPSPVVTVLAACGQRSMTCYLLQSVVFVAALAVLLADGMARRSYRGPAELLLRRLTYARSP